MIITIRIAEDCGGEGKKKEERDEESYGKGKARLFQKNRNRVDRKRVFMEELGKLKPEEKALKGNPEVKN
jgi:hypothetical protein